MRYQYEGCNWPPQRVTDIGFYNQAFLIFNFGRSLPPCTENGANSEFRIEWTPEKEAELVQMAHRVQWAAIADHFFSTASAVRQHYEGMVRRGTV
jgi:hypothetical protein